VTAMMSQPTVGVLGGGSWGTALAIAAHRAGSKVILVTRNKNVIESVAENRINDVYLPQVFIDPAITVTDDLISACKSEILVMAVPSHCVRSACIMVSDSLPTEVPIVIGSKGIEKGSLLLMSEVMEGVLPRNIPAVISGPNFATEVARGKPSATTIACTNKEVGKRVAFALGSALFRPYVTDDIIGAQIAGAVKNVIAIACGIAVGKELGENARAALITRGFAEMSRLAAAKGGNPKTLMGLCGLGDLVLTCSSLHSRNTSFGVALSRETPLGQVVMSEGRGVIEGATSVESVVKLAEKHKVDMPIALAVHRIVNLNEPVDQVIKALIERPFTEE
jgi:glycerol-3-phosphate dehydrogenase (NAD(P)+)